MSMTSYAASTDKSGGLKATFSNLDPIWIRNFLCALLLYPAADFLAQTLTGQWVPLRLLAVSLMGVLIYRREIPRWYAFIENLRLAQAKIDQRPWLQFFLMRDTESNEAQYRLKPIFKGACGTLYFNPFWVTRHMLLLELVTHTEKVNDLPALIAFCFILGCKSFCINAPLSLCLNYILQNKIPLKYRFIGSVAISGLFATLYSLVHRLLR